MKLNNENLNDYIEYCKKKLQSEFVDFDFVDNDEAIYLYQKYKCRIIDNVKRTVKEASGLIIPNEFRSAYSAIKLAIEEGEHLQKYQSKRIKKININDDMLSHWNIHHFHLGGSVGPSGFVDRSGDLLFVFFSSQSAHILGVFPHGSWSDLNLIEIIHKNWSDEMVQIKHNSDTKPLTESEHKTLRKKHCNTTIVTCDGTEYVSPGMVGGDGSTIHAIYNNDKVIFMLNQKFEIIKLNIKQIIDSVNYVGDLDSLTIGLEINELTKQLVFTIKEINSKFTLPN